MEKMDYKLLFYFFNNAFHKQPYVNCCENEIVLRINARFISLLWNCLYVSEQIDMINPLITALKLCYVVYKSIFGMHGTFFLFFCLEQNHFFFFSVYGILQNIVFFLTRKKKYILKLEYFLFSLTYK